MVVKGAHDKVLNLDVKLIVSNSIWDSLKFLSKSSPTKLLIVKTSQKYNIKYMNIYKYNLLKDFQFIAYGKNN